MNITENSNILMNNFVYDTKGRRLSHYDIMRSAFMINCALGLSNVCWSLTGAGSNMLTIFVSEWLGASASVVGVVASLAFFCPVVQPFAAVMLQRVGHRKHFLLILLAIHYLSTMALLFIPFMGRDVAVLQIGIFVVIVVSAVAAAANHFCHPAMMSWIGDLVPESHRSSFFGQQQSFTLIAGSTAFYCVSLVIDRYGGTGNPWMFVANFSTAVAAGVFVLWLWTRVADLPMATVDVNSIKSSLALMMQPCRDKTFRKLLVAVGLLNFSLNLGGTFCVLYLRGSRIGDHSPGLGASLQYFAMITAVGSVASIFSARFWGWFGDKIGAKLLLIVGSLASIWWWTFFIATPDNYRIIVLIGMILSGLFAPAITIGTYSCAINFSPREKRPAYTAALMATLPIAAFGSILAGYLADKFTVTNYLLPTGVPFCYIHLLTILGTAGFVISATTVLAISVPRTKTLREMVSMLSDVRFLMNVVRALILAHGRSKKWVLWSIQSLKGRSSVIAIQELVVRVNDADYEVRWAAVKLLGTLNTEMATEALVAFAVQTRIIVDGTKVDHKYLTQRLCEKYESLTKAKLRNENTTMDPTFCERIDEQLWGVIAKKLILRGLIDDVSWLTNLLANARSDGVRKEMSRLIIEMHMPGNRFYDVMTREAAIKGATFSKLIKHIIHNLAAITDSAIREQLLETATLLEKYYYEEEYEKLITACKSLTSLQNDIDNEVISTRPMRQVLNLLDIKTNGTHSEKKYDIESLMAVFLTISILEQERNTKCNRAGKRISYPTCQNKEYDSQKI